MSGRDALELSRMSVCIAASALLQTFAVQAFVYPAGLLSSGFMGVAILLSRISDLHGVGLSTSVALVALNAPVAMLCFRSVGKRFAVFSIVQVLLASALLRLVSFAPLFDDMLLDIVFGGFLYGMSIVIALKGGASTAGTDFIALYISNRIGRSTWDGILVFNICILCVFGAVFGWSYAAYSVIFQFISTRTIDSFYKRYKCVTVQITTRYPDDILDEYYRRYRHGVSMLDVVGGYSKKRFTLLSTVISAYEVRDVSSLVLAVDRRALIDVIPTEHFYGGFYRQPLK